MSDTIDILVVLDVEDMPALSQDPNNPTGGLNNNVYMYVKTADAVSGQGGAELTIKCNIGDTIRWRLTNLSAGFETTVNFTSFRNQGGTDLLTLPPIMIGGIQQDGTVSTKQENIPNNQTTNNMWTSQQKAVPYYFIQTTAESTGNVTYQIEFQVNNANTGALIGYGIWDPFIDISN